MLLLQMSNNYSTVAARFHLSALTHLHKTKALFSHGLNQIRVFSSALILFSARKQTTFSQAARPLDLFDGMISEKDSAYFHKDGPS